MTFTKTLLTAASLLAISNIHAGDYSAGKETTPIAPAKNCADTPYDSHRVDSHAPIGVMGDHTHEAGEFMFSYRYMYMDMRQNYVGSNEVTAQSQLIPNGGNYMVMPTDMQTEMQMVGAMYAPTDDLTFAFMMPIVDKFMTHITAPGGTFSTHSHGIGDFKFGGLLNIYERGNSRMHLNLMMSAPTGSITERGNTPMGNNVILPFPMQLGSGTWDLKPGITYLGQCGDFSWGAQILGTIRLGENDQNYTLGDDITANIWGAYRVTDALSTSLRVSGTTWGDIDAANPALGAPIPTARPDLRGGERIDVFAGVNYLFNNGHRLAVEAGTPLYQDLDGPQLGMDWMITAGWQKAF